MELVGEENRVQALFSEARRADEQTTPSFVGVWNRAQAETTHPQRAFNLSFVAATALLVCGLVSLAWWMNHSQPSHEAVITSLPSTTTGGRTSVVPPANTQKPAPVFQPPRSSDRSRALKLAAARRQAVQIAISKKVLRDAKTIESWQSPTAALLDSPSDELLKTLPQLNQTVDELKSFLPSRPK
jgi:hypothetical protein